MLYTVDGHRLPNGVSLGRLEGYRSSRPVRVGNSAWGQRPLDAHGEILDSAALLERVDSWIVRERWPIIERLARRTTELWSEPDQGIWEFRSERAHFVPSKLK